MIELDTVLLKVVSRCNINCTYCYVFNLGDTSWKEMPKRMPPETVDRVAESLRDLASHQGRKFAVVLHGGEPLLLGASRLTYLLSSLRRLLGGEHPVSIQTNGMLITNEILDACAEHGVSLSVSIDGPRSVHDRQRVGHDGKGTHAAVLNGIELLRAHQASGSLYAGLLAVIDPESDPAEVYHFIKSLGPPCVDFLYCDGNHDRLPRGKSSVDSTEYGRWLAALLDVYIADTTPIQIRILDDITKLILGGSGCKEGIGMTDYGIAVIDTDGSFAKNDTLKGSFDRADRFGQYWSIHGSRLIDVLSSPEFADYHASQRPTSATCRFCPELGVCGGGMTLHRWKGGNGYDNPSVYCADQKFLISHIRRRLNEMRVCA